MPELDDRVRDLCAETQWPETPDLAATVVATIASGGAAAGPRRSRRLAGLLALLVAGGLVAAPGVRSELLKRLGLKHATVIRVKELPPTTLGRSLGLGEPSTGVAARAAAGFALRRPAALGSPDGVYIDRGAVTFTYGVRRPILFTQVRGTARPFVFKLATRAAGRVDIAGAPGLILAGDHVVVFKPPRGEIREAPSRLAATTVLWERDGRLLRLEGDRPARELVRIARSVR